MGYTIPLSYNPVDIPALTTVLSKYQNVHHNRMVEDLEKHFGEQTGCHAVALNSGTSAIHLAMKLLGVGPGDTIIAPTFTYVATVSPALYLGAKPVFVDAVPGTWNMDPALLKRALTDAENQGVKPKAIVIVHTYGLPGDLDEILRIAADHGIPVLEDAAESFGAMYRNRQVGTFGAIGVYSFNNNKTFTTYGGGALITRNPEWAARAKFLATQARENVPYYEHREAGFNYAMSPLNAACGLSQVPAIGQNIEKRRKIWETYRTAWPGRGVEFQEEGSGSWSNRWFSTVLLPDGTARQAVAEALARAGIESRPLWKPLHLQPVFAGAKACLSGVAENLFTRGICLPSGNDLLEADQQTIIRVVEQTLTGVTKR